MAGIAGEDEAQGTAPGGQGTAPAPAGAPAGALRGPRGDLFGGHLRQLGRDQLGFLTRCAREYGDYVPLRFGPTRALLVSDPEAIEDVLVRQQRYFVKTPALRVSRRLLGNGLVTSEGDFWKRQRRMMQPAFHRQRIAAYAETMAASAGAVLDRWRPGETRDVALEMGAVTMDIVTKTLFGEDVPGDTAQKIGPALRAIGEHFNSRLYSLRFLIPDWMPTPGNLRMRREVGVIDEVIFAMMERHRRTAENGAGDDLLSMLLAAHDEDDGSRMTAQQLRDEVMTLFLAGHETTALALTWALYLLSQHPDAEARLHAELAEVLGGRAPAPGDLPRLRYAEQVVTETLRLYPPAWSLGRQATSDCRVGRQTVRKGTVVLISQWVMHRDPRFFTDPEAFRPERWDGSLQKSLPKFAYFPFGGGPRKCIGDAFAAMEAVLVLATIAQRFRLALAPDQAVATQTFFTLRPKYGMRMVLHRREFAGGGAEGDARPPVMGGAGVVEGADQHEATSAATSEATSAAP